MPSVVFNSSTSSSLPSIWDGGSGASLKYGSFLGYAKDGWDLYNSTSGLPGLRSFRNGVKFDIGLVGVGAGYDVDLRTGINLDLQAATGSADLNLNDQIEFTWTQDAANFYLSSSYSKHNTSSLSVTGPEATLQVDGRFDISGSVYLRGRSFWGSWSRRNIMTFSNGEPLFSRKFNSTDNLSLDVFGLGKLSYSGISLNTTSANNIQLSDGVISRIVDPMINANLDLDAVAGRFLGLPTGLTLSASAFGFGASLTLADAKMSYTGSINQTLQAKIDTITGTLNVEGKPLNYTVGSTITLPKTTYDSNNDGKLDISGSFFKQGKIINNTDLINSLSSRLTGLSGKLSAFGWSRNLGPLFDSGPIAIASRAIDIFDNTWNANLGTTSSLGFTLA